MLDGTVLRPPSSGVCDLILVSWNHVTHLKRCLDTLFSHTTDSFRLIIIDNASDAATVSYLHDIERQHPDRVTVCWNRENVGWVRGVNQGLRRATAPFVCLMNNDLALCDGWLSAMIEVAQRDPAIGLVNPRYNRSGESFEAFQTAAEAYRRTHAEPAYHELNECNGACLLVTRRALEMLSGLDERYHIGGMDDSDLSRRATAAGLRCVQAHRAWVFHEENVSCNDVPDYWRTTRKANEELFVRQWGRPKHVVVCLDDSVLDNARELTRCHALARLGVGIHLWGSEDQRLRCEKALHDVTGGVAHQNLRVRYVSRGVLRAWWGLLCCVRLAARRGKGGKRFHAVIAGSPALRRALALGRWLHAVPIYENLMTCDAVAAEREIARRLNSALWSEEEGAASFGAESRSRRAL